MSISVTHLTKLYGTQKAVNNISFQIDKGAVVGFLGPNGAGKSTTMKMIAGYLKPDGGEAEVCGEIVSSNPLEIKRKIGYLPESNPLYYDMYVREYLGFIAGVHQVKNKSQQIGQVIDTVGLTPEVNKKIGQLSKGYKQRVGLAAALVHDPEVLILDEPTSGLDPNQLIEIREVIKKLAHRKTILFSSHILQEVEAVCNRVIIINKGNIVADDTLSNLQKSGSGIQLVKIVFKEVVDIGLLKELGDVTQMEQITIVKLSNGQSAFNIPTSQPEQVRKHLLELSLKNNLNIVSLQSENNSLEEIFRSLTMANGEWSMVSSL